MLHATQYWVDHHRVRGPLTPVEFGDPVPDTTVTPYVMATVFVPNILLPYRLNVMATSESGSTSVGTRWNHQVEFVSDEDGSVVVLASSLREENVEWGLCTTGGPVGQADGQPFRSAGVVRYVLVRAYGGAEAMYSEYNRDLRVWMHPTASS